MTDVKSINISTDPAHLSADDFGIEGEEIGNEKIIDWLLELFASGNKIFAINCN